MSTARPSLALKVAAALAVPVVVVGGLWLFAGVLAPSYTWSLILEVAWFVAAGFGIGKLIKPHPELRVPCAPRSSARWRWSVGSSSTARR